MEGRRKRGISKRRWLGENKVKRLSEDEVYARAIRRSSNIDLTQKWEYNEEGGSIDSIIDVSLIELLAGELATVTEWAKACVRKWEKMA